MRRKVKAAVLKEPGKIDIQKFSYPKLDEGCVLVKMEMSGICGTDKHLYKGENKFYASTIRETTALYPIIQGHENYGVVFELSQKGRKKIIFLW